MPKLSRVFWPTLAVPKNSNRAREITVTSKSQKLMLELGLLKSVTNGTFHIMPLAQRSLDKLCDLIDSTMKRVNGQKLTLSLLTASDMWRKSKRLENDIAEFFMVQDRHQKEFLLSPTHEESITSMMANISPISYKQLPLRLYQIGYKFRDELKPRFGLIRSKEFLMKDMYSFDCNEKMAQHTYELINTEAYEYLFKLLEMPLIKVEASSGIMGGQKSHEYHFPSDTGEDSLLRCLDCGYSCNAEIFQENLKHQVTDKSFGVKECLKCQSKNMEEIKAIEVAHTFMLGDRYSKVFNATYNDKNGKSQLLYMCSYGIGVTRILAAALEVLSNDFNLRWPKLLAPYDVCIIGPKHGSKEEEIGNSIEADICLGINRIYNGSDDYIHDDRKQMTIGKRLHEAKRIGYPLIVVIGTKCMEPSPQLELFKDGNCLLLDVNSVLDEIKQYKQQVIWKSDALLE